VLRILILACVSEPIFIYYFQSYVNAFIPLAFGAIYILILDCVIATVKKTALMLCTALLNIIVFILTAQKILAGLVFTLTDKGLHSVMEILLTGHMEIITCALLIVVFWCFLTTHNKWWLMLSLPFMLCLNTVVWQVVLMVFVSYTLIALAYNTRPFDNLRINKWIGYWFYPFHLLILSVIWGQA
jgi:hypothetical protein